MAIEIDGVAERAQPAGAGNSWREPLGEATLSSTGAGSNEVPDKLASTTDGASQILRAGRLGAVPRVADSLQWPTSTVYSSLGSGKSSAFLRTLITSGAPAKTITDRIESPVVRKAPGRREHVVLHQQWEGYVERLTSSGFRALLVDITGDTDEEEVTDIEFDEVSEFDRPLIEPGAVFYWSLGYRVRTSGQREGMSVIRFRRLPRWTPAELEAAEKAASATRELFGWKSEPDIGDGSEARSI